MENPDNKASVKSNTYRYKKDKRDKSQQTKTTSKMNRIIRTMEDEGHSTDHLAPTIYMERAMAINSDSDNSDSDGNSSDSSE